ncbi:MAG: CZB domain-containing protein [Candidatus Theseobacter exili]|nr:CZB domain-containing protein [Candidatus Theseobacter exili]
MKKIDFTQAIIDHVVWNVKLRSFLDGEESISQEEAVSQKSCLLGKWLCAYKPSECGTIPEIQELKGVHIQLHEIVRQVITLKLGGNMPAAEKKLAKLKPVSEKIIHLLVAIEKKVKEFNLQACLDLHK